MALARATALDYAQLLHQHLPRGPAWPEQNNLLAGLAQELARVHNRLLDLIEEADPRTVAERLPEWERMAGLPDTCVTVSQTMPARRQALVARLTMPGGQSRPYFIDLAATLGYAIAITEFRVHTCEHDCEHPLYDDPWRFAWQATAPLDTIRERTCEDSCEDALRAWGNQLLECVLTRVKPAHTHLIFAYV